MIDKTIDFYNLNANRLQNDYDNANMLNAYECIEKYLNKSDIVLDIGFGSGRDIRYFLSKGISIYGIDGSESFIKLFKEKYPKLKNKVSYSKLPKIDVDKFQERYFDLIFSMATWMHIPKVNQQETINNIKKVLKNHGVLILSYSCKERKDDPRFFEDLNPKEVESLFIKNNFKIMESKKSEDGLNRKDILWVTQVYILEEKDQ